MSDYLSAVEARIEAVLSQGRGVDGALGPEAQNRAITAGTFRKQPDNADMNDPFMPPELFDRGYVLRFRSMIDAPFANNPYQGPQFREVGLRVMVGYLYGAALSAIVDPRGTEVAATAVLRADRRAISDAYRIDRALRFGPLRGLDTDPGMVECRRINSEWVDLGGGRSLGVTDFALVLQSDELSAYGP